MRAGFLESEVYMCMRVFDVQSWQRLGDEKSVDARRLHQLRKARALCESYGVPYSQSGWEQVDAACKKKEELLLRRGDPPSCSAEGTYVDNREVWSALLPPVGTPAEESLLRSPSVERVVRSYIYIYIYGG